MKSLKDFNYLLSLDRRYTKTESEIFRQMLAVSVGVPHEMLLRVGKTLCCATLTHMCGILI